MKQAMLEFLRQAIDGKDQKAEKFATASLDARRIASALSMAEPEIFVTPAELDCDPYALNFLNGTVDLRTSELRQHNRADLITKLIRYEYCPEATCGSFLPSLWEEVQVSPQASTSAQSA